LVPYCELPVSSPLGSAPQVVWLAGVAQVFRGMYRGPFDRDVPLPPHYWELSSLTDDTVFIRSTRSSKFGVSFLLKGQKLKKSDPADQWILSLRPDIAEDDLPIMTTAREIWIDLDQNTWVLNGEFPIHDKRKLMRVPLWTSSWKARSGGFSDGPPGGFLTSGVVTTAELRKELGTDKRPWKLVVDHNFFRTYVQLRYFNFDAKVMNVVPPGLCIKALGKRLDQKSMTQFVGTVGGGTATDLLGTVFVLHERTEEQSADVEMFWDDIAFSQSGPARRVRYVDIKSHVLERTPASQVPASLKDSYVLPGTWHSVGWEATIGFGGPRNLWADLRPKPADATPARSLVTTADTPVAFHLDDIVLADTTGLPLAPFTQSSAIGPALVGLYDHFLRVRQPDIANNRPQLWATPIVRPYLPGDDGFAAFNEDPEQTTRLVVRENRFFDVRDNRVEPGSGKLGTVPGVGARIAKEQDHPWVDYLDGVPWLARNGGADKYGMCQIHLIDTPHAKDSRGNGLQPLLHVVVSVPCWPQPVTQPDDGLFYQMLLDVEKRWSQGNPGIAPGTKDYAVVPRDPGKTPKECLRFRILLALVSADNGKALKLKRGMPAGAGVSVEHATNTRLVNCADNALTVKTANSSDADQVSFGRHGMSHEFGHVWGLYDEYPLSEPPPNVTGAHHNGVSRVPSFTQSWSNGRSPKPFVTDWSALMHNNLRPRLRHYWQFVEALNHESMFSAALPDGPYVLENQHGVYEGGRLRYELPVTTKRFPGSDLVKPWDPIWQGTLGLSDAMLLRLGDDEGSVGNMFQAEVGGKEKPPLRKNQRYDGLLVLRTYFWFDFEGPFVGQTSPDPLEPLDTDSSFFDAQWRVARKLHDLIYDRKTVNPRWLLSLVPNPAAFGGAAPLFQRIAVLFQPQVEFGPRHGRTGPINTSSTPSAGGIAARVWCIVEDDGGKTMPHPLLQSAQAQPMRIGRSQVDLSLLRFALGIPWAMFLPAPFNKWVPNDKPFDAADLAGITQLVGQALGDPVGSGAPSRLVQVVVP